MWKPIVLARNVFESRRPAALPLWRVWSLNWGIAAAAVAAYFAARSRSTYLASRSELALCLTC
jgi:hypothetical protein